MRAAKQAAREAERRFPVRIRIAIPPEGLSSRLDQNDGLVGRELRFRWLDLHPIQHARRRQRCAGCLFHRHDDGECPHGPLVRGAEA
jgi:hypothetical protein